MKYFVENVEEQWRFASSSSSETTVVAVILVILNQILPFLGAFFPVTLTQLLYGADVKTNAGLIRCSSDNLFGNTQSTGLKFWTLRHMATASVCRTMDAPVSLRPTKKNSTRGRVVSRIYLPVAFV